MAATLFLILRILWVIALYAFLGWALISIWRALKQQSRALSPAQLPRITIVEAEKSPALSFQKMQILIGRDPACDVCLSDPTVSAQHARLDFHDSQWWVEDLQSTNGTYVNGVDVSQPLVVTNGDDLRIGQIVLRIEL